MISRENMTGFLVQLICLVSSLLEALAFFEKPRKVLKNAAKSFRLNNKLMGVSRQDFGRRSRRFCSCKQAVSSQINTAFWNLKMMSPCDAAKPADDNKTKVSNQKSAFIKRHAWSSDDQNMFCEHSPVRWLREVRSSNLDVTEFR